MKVHANMIYNGLKVRNVWNVKIILHIRVHAPAHNAIGKLCLNVHLMVGTSTVLYAH